MTTVIEASGLGKRYGRRWALAECTLAVPALAGFSFWRINRNRSTAPSIQAGAGAALIVRRAPRQFGARA